MGKKLKELRSACKEARERSKAEPGNKALRKTWKKLRDRIRIVKEKKQARKEESEAGTGGHTNAGEGGGGSDVNGHTQKRKLKREKRKRAQEFDNMGKEGGGKPSSKTKKKRNKKLKKSHRDMAAEEEKGKGPSSSSSSDSSALPPHRRILAPMVGGSELAFRMLCRRYGVDLCYTPMMYSSKFAADAKYREEMFHTHPKDRPLVAHFCGNDPEVMLKACRMVQDKVDAVDINLGCPQRIAYSGHFGSYLLGKEDHGLVMRIVSTLSRNLKIPVFCKIRLLDDLDDTIAFCKQLESSGCSLLAVHARYRGTATRRRDGPAHLEQVVRIKAALSIPVISNELLC